MALLRRTLDAAFLNAVCNDPDVRPWGHGAGPIDVTEIVRDPANIVMVGEHGGWIAKFIEAGRYEIHTQVLPAGRGQWAYAAGEEGIRHMFVATDALVLVTKVPADNLAALMLTRQIGFQEVFRRPDAWDNADGSRVEVIYFSLSFDRWRARDKVIADEGHAFHLALEQAKAEAGSPLAAHPDDEAHDRAAGASQLMVKAGNPMKAVLAYNRWASFAGYQMIALLGLNPLLIDVRDAVITVIDGKMEIVLCR